MWGCRRARWAIARWAISISGAGRIVYQDLTRINKAIQDGELAKNPVLQEAFAQAKGHRLHLLGLLSDGGRAQPHRASDRAGADGA